MFKVRKIASLQYLSNISKKKKKKGRDEVDFLPADKHETILQVDNINLGGHGQAFPNYPK